MLICRLCDETSTFVINIIYYELFLFCLTVQGNKLCV